MSFILREAEKIICAVLFLAMTFLGFANVVVRYGTNYSLAVTEELLTNGFLLLTVFGAAVAARRGDHLAVTLVHDMLPPALQRVIFLISLLLSLGLLAMSAWFSWQSVINMIDSGIRSYGLGLPAWYYQIGVPFGFALVLIRYLQHAIDVMRGGVDDTGLPDV
jgi:TRAP-type C4-dicarboxylate transport system permease small subunit